jgi:hypothetical protein
MDDHRELSLQSAQLKIEADQPVWAPARGALWRRIAQHDFEPARVAAAAVVGADVAAAVKCARRLNLRLRSLIPPP